MHVSGPRVQPGWRLGLSLEPGWGLCGGHASVRASSLLLVSGPRDTACRGVQASTWPRDTAATTFHPTPELSEPCAPVIVTVLSGVAELHLSSDIILGIRGPSSVLAARTWRHRRLVPDREEGACGLQQAYR